MMLLSAIAVTGFVVELTVRPRLDLTRSGRLLLWHGRKERKFINLINL